MKYGIAGIVYIIATLSFATLRWLYTSIFDVITWLLFFLAIQQSIKGFRDDTQDANLEKNRYMKNIKHKKLYHIPFYGISKIIVSMLIIFLFIYGLPYLNLMFNVFFLLLAPFIALMIRIGAKYNESKQHSINLHAKLSLDQLKIWFILLIFIEAIAGLELSVKVSSFIFALLILVATHELIHAISYWSYGCSAIPIPITLTFGITIARCSKHLRLPKVAPLTITLIGFIMYLLRRDSTYLVLSILNLGGSAYDIASAL